MDNIVTQEGMLPMPLSCGIGCVVVGTPDPSHSFTDPHPTIYETTRVI